MNQKRLNQLDYLLENNYKLILSKDDSIIITNRKTGRVKKKTWSRSRYVFIFHCSITKRSWDYSELELICYAKGYDLLNVRVPELLKNESIQFITCNDCKLDYPPNEMRGNICYLCVEEIKKCI